MSPQEHYFENILYQHALAYRQNKDWKWAWDIATTKDSNIDEISAEEKRTIEMCAWYTINTLLDGELEKISSCYPIFNSKT